MAEQTVPGFAALLRQLRVQAKLTQEELAEATGLSPRSISDLERGINRTARKYTALLLADALGLGEPGRAVFVAAARGQVPAAEVLAVISPARNNLPAPVDCFVGRRMELAEIIGAVRADRLVTLTGAGGSGKTRLALEAAKSLTPEFDDGIWLVALAALNDGERLTGTVAHVLGVAGRANEEIADTLQQWLQDRCLLLILDNCEHIVDAVRRLCERQLPASSRLRILATSREFLDTRGEHAIPTPPMTVPDDVSQASLSDAVQLFMVRAAARAPHIRLDERNLRTVMQVCRRVDGLPLAIELTAARLRSLSLTQLAIRLDEQFWLLTGGRGAEVPRHQTLEAVVKWSYDLLSEAEQRAFGRLAVFPDHFTLEMAETVLTAAPVRQSDVMGIISRLVDKSLITTVNAPDELRYQLLEMLREYGRDRLIEWGETDQIRERLLGWALSGVKHLESVIRTPSQDEALRKAAINAATYRTAMTWAASHRRHGDALRIAAMVPISPHFGERRAEILGRLEKARTAGQLDEAAAGHAWAAICNIAFAASDWQAALKAGTLAAEHFQAARLPRFAAWARYIKAHSAWGAGQLDEADRLIAESIVNFRRVHDDMGLGYALWLASLRSSDLGAAEQMAAEADELLRQANATIGFAHNVEGRGIIAYERGELSRAARFLTEAVETFASYGDPGCTAHALEAAAVVVDGDVATQLLTAAKEFRRQSGQGHRPWEIQARLGDLGDHITRSGTRPSAAAPGAERPYAPGAHRPYTLSAASLLASQALQRVAAGHTA